MWLSLIALFLSVGFSIFSQHSANSNINLTSLPKVCGIGPVGRGHALGFRFVSKGSNAKILDVSTYDIRIIS